MTQNSGQIKFLLKHSSIYGIGSLLSKAVAFLLLPLYTSHLDPTAYGILEILDTTSSMVGLVVGIGMASAMTRFYFDFDSDEYKARLVSTVFILVFIGSAIVLGIASGFAGVLARVLFQSDQYSKLFLLSFASLGVGVMFD